MLVAVMGLFVRVNRHVKCVAKYGVKKAVNHAVSYVVEVPNTTTTLMKRTTMSTVITIMKGVLAS